MNDPNTLTYIARKSVPSQWRTFLRALMETLESHLDGSGREGMMRLVGARMAALMPLPACATMAELEARINDALAAADWGYVQMSLDMGNRAMVLRHVAAPLVGTHSDVAGNWVGSVLEGLYGGWLGSQPGAEPGTPVRRVGPEAGAVVLKYAKAA
ncbi:cellulose biosynthesis protein BcsD [Roseococcus sp. YIM B11640]|uniref:cellulose biosynthesis protein BcsD n=1 Tax=Roseococcus sp. YIM B11640 TaxID=3133973 RepID=UPI003C7C1057